MFFSRMKLGTKLVFAFAVTLVFMAVVAAMGINRMGSIYADMEEIVQIDNKKVAFANKLIDGMNAIQIAVRNLLITQDEAVNNKQKATIDKARGDIADAIGQLSKIVVTAEGKQALTSLIKTNEAAKAVNTKVIALGLANQNKEAIKVLLEEAAPVNHKTIEMGMQFIQAASDATGKSAKSAKEDYYSSQLLMTIASVLAFAIAGVLAFFLTRSITGPIGRVTEGLAGGADQVASASGQVAASSQNLAEGASEQAAGIEETSSSLEEISSMTRQNAQSSKEANEIMHETSKVVSSASESMHHLTSSMSEISRASEETQKIVKTIDEISFQTNLLALNAAVEAARAGEAGAGFAVVADEVRNLAMRAAEAAKNTASLIEDTVTKIRDGSEIVGKTSSEFSKVVGSTAKMTEIIGEIAVASQEQAQGIEQISRGILEMDKVVQRNAANAEESASASEEMNAQAEQMKTYVEELEAVIRGRGKGAIVTERQVAARIRDKNKDQPVLPANPAKKPVTAKDTLKARKVSPEKLIPFEEDSEISNF